MDRLKRAAIITKLIQELRKKESWCGETHIQKTVFFLQKLMQVPLDYNFILYKYGPFSFDLRDELTGLRADELIVLKPEMLYGPRVETTKRSNYIQDIYSETLAKYDKCITFIVNKFSDKGVSDLERLATAYYITHNKQNELSVETRAEELVSIKPHIKIKDAISAIKEVDKIILEAESYMPCSMIA